jgi:hypothetical protein
LKNGDEIAAVARVKKEAVDESETAELSDGAANSEESDLSPDAPTNE